MTHAFSMILCFISVLLDIVVLSKLSRYVPTYLSKFTSRLFFGVANWDVKVTQLFFLETTIAIEFRLHIRNSYIYAWLLASITPECVLWKSATIDIHSEACEQVAMAARGRPDVADAARVDDDAPALRRGWRRLPQRRPRRRAAGAAGRLSTTSTHVHVTSQKGTLPSQVHFQHYASSRYFCLQLTVATFLLFIEYHDFYYHDL